MATKSVYTIIVSVVLLLVESQRWGWLRV